MLYEKENEKKFKNWKPRNKKPPEKQNKHIFIGCNETTFMVYTKEQQQQQ